jgi:DNA-binding transcriptional MerR regulator/methanogenic corrinoid protein MtbC1
MSEHTKSEKRHPIQVVSRRTGLSADVLRVWEKRYGVVEPGRSEGGRRLYSDADVDHLRLLHRASEAGRRIGRIAELSTDELREMVREDERQEARVRGSQPAVTGSPDRHLAAAWQAVEGFDPKGLESALMRASVALSAPVLIDDVAAPLLQRIGETWAHGELSPGNEHLASAVMRQVLSSLVASCSPDMDAPRIVVATPTGQIHEFGALFAAAVAAAEGWRVIYLGTDLPGSDIAQVADETGAEAIALSLVYPPASPGTEAAIAELGSALVDPVAVTAGGAAAESYAEALEEAGAELVADLRGLREWLRGVAEQA